MQINEPLTLVMPFYADDAPDADPYAWVHSIPISRDVFDSHYRMLCRMMADIPAIGGNLSVSINVLMDAAVALDPKNGKSQAEALIQEIMRLTEVCVAVPGRGWERMPLEDAQTNAAVLPEDVREAVAAVIFFSAAWHTQPRRTRREFLDFAAKTLGAQIISLSATEFFNSLPMSTAAEIGLPPPQVPMTSEFGAQPEDRRSYVMY
jgi:hypothetical protein